MATAEAKAALSDCFKKSRVSDAVVKFIESVGVETLDDFANYVRRDKYEEDLKELQARGPEPGAGGRGGSAHGAETPGVLECRGLQYHKDISLILRRGDNCLDAGGSVLARRMLMEHGAHAHVASQIIPTAMV